ncbi:MAG: hypothetical protein H6972_12220 [Gammaproteobacteria bacterium]|nr:hypothetical protein [Gammaproteobacteria bacterium]
MSGDRPRRREGAAAFAPPTRGEHTMPYYIHKKYWIGIHGGLYEATEAEVPTCERLTPYDFQEVAREEYENTVLDLRYEDGEWQQ